MRLRMNNLETMPSEIEIPNDRWSNPPGVVRAGVDAKAGSYLLSDGGSPYLRPAFHDQDSGTRLGEIQSGCEAVDAGADDYRVVTASCFPPRSRRAPAHAHARRISIAANRPDAPMIPPPG